MLRIYLSGPMRIESESLVLGPETFPGEQGRVAFACLVGHRGPVSRSALATVVWPAGLPTAWREGLSPIISRLRALLSRIGIDGRTALRLRDSSYVLRLPARTWIDHEVALSSIHQAEAALASGNAAEAYGPSGVALQIAQRPFLPGMTGAWLERRRSSLRGILLRALECRAEVYVWNRQHSLAVEAAREAVTLEPFRESSHRLLMRAHAAAGNGAQALLAYEQCRKLIAEELGVRPSTQTQALHTEILRSM